MNQLQKLITVALRPFGGGRTHLAQSSQLFFLGLLITALGMSPFLAKTYVVFASGASYYVSPTGRDTNPGTNTAPFLTFAKGVSMLRPGDTLFAFGGTYSNTLRVSSSGSSGLPLTIRAVAGQHPVINMAGSASNLVYVTGSYVVVSGFEVTKSSGDCVHFDGQYDVIQTSVVHECHDMGIYADGQYDTIDHNTVYHASTINSGFTMPSGWASGIKVHVGGSKITISNNTVYNNYGEGIAVTRGTYSTVVGNTVYDNYLVNIYIDNSHNILVENNFTVDHPNGGFLKNGSPSEGIGLGEEYYAGWGAQLSNITIQNNISAFTSHGVIFFGNDSGSPNGGLKNSTIAFNTFWGSSHSEINLAYDAGQSGVLIADNIVGQSSNNLIILANPLGIRLTHNFWSSGLPALYARASGDKTGNVLFATTPGYTPDTYKLGTGSPALGAGLAEASITTDFYGNSRGPSYDMGAIQHLGAIQTLTNSLSSDLIPTTVPPANMPTSTPVPTSTPTPTPKPKHKK